MTEREDCIEKARAHLADWTAEIEAMEARMNQAPDAAKVYYAKTLTFMRQRRDDAEAELAKVQSADEGAWPAIQADFHEAWEEIASAIRDTRSRF
ncbi:hypothetical protein [Salipiger mucosus]|uniref:Uncharacterized protein n=1 Tax=Salipiger mucosus DSM 16094 TaxID=1123237 RepID=S9R0B8_9RHOB|nr:hypothetical protein [Salipiger mucosus]EPX85312.1 hypothetical protein Salmuc_02691 [Salipiger mucosus DSM 16094]